MPLNETWIIFYYNFRSMDYNLKNKQTQNSKEETEVMF